MSDHVYRIVEIVGSSTTSSDDAIHTAIGRAARPSATSTGSRSSRPAATWRTGAWPTSK